MLGLSAGHILVLLIVLLIFGPRRLPELGSSLGRTLKNLKDGMNGAGLDLDKPSLEAKTEAEQKPDEGPRA